MGTLKRRLFAKQKAESLGGARPLLLWVRTPFPLCATNSLEDVTAQGPVKCPPPSSVIPVTLPLGSKLQTDQMDPPVTTEERAKGLVHSSNPSPAQNYVGEDLH